MKKKSELPENYRYVCSLYEARVHLILSWNLSQSATYNTLNLQVNELDTTTKLYKPQRSHNHKFNNYIVI